MTKGPRWEGSGCPEPALALRPVGSGRTRSVCEEPELAAAGEVFLHSRQAFAIWEDSEHSDPSVLVLPGGRGSDGGARACPGSESKAPTGLGGDLYTHFQPSTLSSAPVPGRWAPAGS